ncbi:hypothetical protein M9H77_02438 [Catharanthus roseus]|uniref:Uncharacterized protein n=1 Tax=Catharanthus roseus TaxID=4058 RepID=A0ACC0C8F6_CATRO|nr:hypothetical protein M9H77_02438 [Catharanthus roseus]
MKVIMQELQKMIKDMTDMRGNMTNLSMEHRGRNSIGEHVSSHTQWGYGYFSRAGSGIVVLFLWCKRRRQVPIGAKIFLLFVRQALRIRCGVENHEGQGDMSKIKFMDSSKVEESLKTHATEEKRRVEQGSFNTEQSVIESISTSFIECDKFEAQNMENKGSLCYKLYKAISFLPSTSFLSIDLIINESSSCSFSLFWDRFNLNSSTS